MSMFSKPKPKVNPCMVLLARFSRRNEVLSSIRRDVPVSQLSNVRAGFYAQADSFQHGELYILSGKDRTAIAKF